MSLEERVVAIEKDTEHHQSRIDEAVDHLKSLDEKVDLILQNIAGNRGFFKGALFAITTIGAVLGAAVAEVAHRVLGNN